MNPAIPWNCASSEDAIALTMASTSAKPTLAAFRVVVLVELAVSRLPVWLYAATALRTACAISLPVTSLWSLMKSLASRLKNLPVWN